jgi:hypothetical protein
MGPNHGTGAAERCTGCFGRHVRQVEHTQACQDASGLPEASCCACRTQVLPGIYEPAGQGMRFMLPHTRFQCTQPPSNSPEAPVRSASVIIAGDAADAIYCCVISANVQNDLASIFDTVIINRDIDRWRGTCVRSLAVSGCALMPPARATWCCCNQVSSVLAHMITARAAVLLARSNKLCACTRTGCVLLLSASTACQSLVSHWVPPIPNTIHRCTAGLLPLRGATVHALFVT